MSGQVRYPGTKGTGNVTPEAQPKGTATERWGKIFMAISVVAWGVGAVAGFQVALTILTVVGFLAVLAGFRWPTIGLFGVGILCTIDPLTRSLLLSGGLLRWNTLNYLLLFYMVVNLGVLLRLRGAIVRLQQIFSLILIGWLLVTPSLSDGIAHLLNFVTSFGLLIFFVRSSSDRKIWFWMPATNALLAAIGGGLFVLRQASLPWVNPNAWMLFPLAGMASVVIAFFFPLSQKRQLSLGILAMVNLAWVFLSASRGGILIALVALPFLFVKLRTLWQRLVLVGTGAALAILMMAMFVELDQHTLHRVSKLFDTEESVRERTSGRSYLFLGGWYMFLDHPFGVGTGGYAQAWAHLGFVQGITSEFSYQEERAAHSGWVKVLAENGLPGILVFTAFVGSFALIGWKKRKRKNGALWIGLYVTGVLALALVTTEFQSKLLWFITSAGTVLLYLRNRAEVGRDVQVPRSDVRRRVPLEGVERG